MNAAVSMDFKEHICEIPLKAGYSVYIEKIDPAWTLNIQKQATETDLEENHHLENVGDIIWATEIGILYCPFCGEKLSAPASDIAGDYCQIQHHDYSRYR